MKKNKTIQLVLILMLSSGLYQTLLAQQFCSIGCWANIDYFPSQNENVVIHPQDMVAVTNGDCPPTADLTIGLHSLANPGSTVFLDSLIFPPDSSGQFQIAVTISDGFGNPISTCWGNITITQGTGNLKRGNLETHFCK